MIGEKRSKDSNHEIVIIRELSYTIINRWSLDNGCFKLETLEGEIFMINSKNEFHSLNGPAVLYTDGTSEFWRNGKLLSFDNPPEIDYQYEEMVALKYRIALPINVVVKHHDITVIGNKDIADGFASCMYIEGFSPDLTPGKGYSNEIYTGSYMAELMSCLNADIPKKLEELDSIRILYSIGPPGSKIIVHTVNSNAFHDYVAGYRKAFAVLKSIGKSFGLRQSKLRFNTCGVEAFTTHHGNFFISLSKTSHKIIVISPGHCESIIAKVSSFIIDETEHEKKMVVEKKMVEKIVDKEIEIDPIESNARKEKNNHEAPSEYDEILKDMQKCIKTIRSSITKRVSKVEKEWHIIKKLINQHLASDIDEHMEIEVASPILIRTEQLLLKAGFSVIPSCNGFTIYLK